MALRRRLRRMTTPLFHELYMRAANGRIRQRVIMNPRVQKIHQLFPSLPHWFAVRFGSRGPTVPRSLEIPELPDELRTYPGVMRDRAKEEEAFRTDGPLIKFTEVHNEALNLLRWHQWGLDVFTIPRRTRDVRLVNAVRNKKAATADPDVDSVELTKQVKKKAEEIGLAAIGVTDWDPLLTFAPSLDTPLEGKTVIVCVSEQHYKATQKIPSLRSEIAHYNTYMMSHPAELSSYLRDLGYVANVYSEHGANIGYAVEAGLGQLGLNGQLLTPFAGPRIRLHIVITDAPLVRDKPVDYGVPAICDKCQVCVRNCPTGAVRSTREWHRGVLKAKIKTERCLPIVIQAQGCGICMKVCPAQKYGLPAVIDEYKRSGEILGKGTDDLEGYAWPWDGKYYGADERPRAGTPEILNPPHADYVYDPDRKEPPEGTIRGEHLGGLAPPKEEKPVM